jgi:prepilin-type N-terminal cleavage/methylation domain-containing protein/prepilin-type processing-associated H-X9-DG protein
MKKLGFTLIELLVVIAIIAILAAILFPVFAQAREKARAISCLSNEKQIGLAILQYNQDFDEYFPYSNEINNGVEVRWYDTVQPYVKNGSLSNGMEASSGHYKGIDGIWHCPSFPTDQDAEYGTHKYIFPVNADSSGNLLTPVVPLSALNAPANTIIVVEKGQNEGNSSWPYFNAHQYWCTSSLYTSGTFNPNGPDYTRDGTPIGAQHDCDLAASNSAPNWGADFGQCGNMPRYRHMKTCNVIYGDGHVKAVHSINWYNDIYDPTVYSIAASSPAKDTLATPW